MNNIKPTACADCGTDAHLVPKWDFKSKVGWIMCDGCGRVSSPLPLEVGSARFITQWNVENRPIPTVQEKR